MNGRSLRVAVKPVLLALCLSLLGLAQTIELTQTIDLTRGPADLQIIGSVFPPFPILSVTSGDINGDGIDDVIMRGGFPEVSVVFGKKNWPGEIRLSQETPPDLVVTNLRGYTFLPFTTTVVDDINGDHIGDLLIPSEDGIEVIWGRKSWPARVDVSRERTALKIIPKDKVSEGASGLTLIATGDINGDGIADLLFSHTVSQGSDSAEENKKEDLAVSKQEIAWILWGRTTWPATIDLTRQQVDVVLVAEQPKPAYRMIRDLGIGDLDGDGFADIIVGPWDDVRGIRIPPQNAPWATAWIIPGRSDFPNKVELKLSVESDGPSDSNGREEKPVALVDVWPQGMFVGGGVAVDDLKADGRKDLVLSLGKNSNGNWIF